VAPLVGPGSACDALGYGAIDESAIVAGLNRLRRSLVARDGTRAAIRDG